MFIMSTIAEIKSKYQLDGGAVSVTVDLESMREGAKNALSEAETFARDLVREADRGIPRSDREWMNRRKTRISNDIREQRRKLALAQKYIDEINGILEKVNEKISEAK